MTSCNLENEDATMDTPNSTHAEATNVAVQLIEFTRADHSDKSTIKLNDELFKSLVARAGDRPVSVICICGPSRQGKSFLLGYMVRCLEALEEDNSDWMDWDNRSKPLKGFKFENGVNPVTQGIWVWNRPFIVKNDQDKEVAVLLVDTQGTNDEFTTAKDMSAIVGLSLLVSSVTIFNFFNNLQEDILAALNMFVQYGLVAMENAEGAPFQKLLFLIRDWNMPGSYPYGDAGGKKFIEDKIKVKPGQPPEVVQVRQMITKCFEDVDCFLMPHIGEKAITNENFTGSIGELSPLFARKMEEFISSLISSDTIAVKRVLGNPVSMSELKSFLDVYVQVFNSNDVPSAHNMWEATSDAHLITCVSKSQKKFMEFMKKRQRGSSYLSEDELESALCRAEKQAVELFQKEKKFAGKEKAELHQHELVKILEKAKTEIKSQNDEKRNNFVTGAISDATTQFRSLLEDAVGFDPSDPFHFHEESEVKKAAKQVMYTVIEDFKEKLMNESEESVRSKEQTVRSILASTLETHVGKNSLRRAAAEGEMQKIVEICAEAYREQTEQTCFENRFSDFYKFENLLESIKENGIKSFDDHKKPGSGSFRKSYRTQLEKKMDEAYSNLKNSHKLRLQEFQAKVDTFIGEACDLYGTLLREQMKVVQTDEEVEQIHLSRVGKSMQSFKNEGNPYPEGHDLHLESCNKLQNKLEGVYQTALEEAAKAKKRVEDSYSAAVSNALDHYTGKMKEIAESYEFMVQEDLQMEHDQVVKEGLEIYEGIEKLGVLKNASDFTQVLVDGCAKQFEKIIEENKQKHEHAKVIAQNTMNECLNKYEEIMKEIMNKSRSLEELDVCHRHALTVAKDLLMESCPGKNNAAFIQEYEQQLEEAIDETFDELKEIFNMRLKVEGAATKSLLVDCTNFYHNQMQTHVQNERFLLPQTLLEHHAAAVNAVLQRFDQQQPLTRNQKMDLKTEMGLLFQRYRLENDMKLNYRTKGEPPAIGIDLGTTYCCVGVYLNGEVIIIPNQKQGGQLTTPSFVAYEADGSVTVGAPAKENAFKNPENTIFDAKRIIGRSINDENLQNDMVCWPFTVVSDNGVPRIKLSNGRLLYPEEISAALLRECREIVEDYLKLPRNTIKKAVITVPAYFEDGQRQATVSAGRLAGLEVLTILNEPTAAAIAYSQKRRDAGARKVLIFDMGGGTFDVAVLDMKAGEIEVLGVSGDTHLGGEDFDGKVMRYCANEFKRKHRVDLLVGKDSSFKTEKDMATRTMRRLQMYCENSKKNLSTALTVDVSLDAITRNLDLNVTVSREVFEEINEVYFSRSIEIVEAALKKVGVRKENIDDIVLVGGSTRIPRIQELLTGYFGGKALNRSIHPDQAVAYGAAIKAAMLNGEKMRGELGLDSLRIQDVTPFSLGIETYRMDLSVIIPKNSKFPITRTQVYYTPKDNLTSVDIIVYQGENLAVAAKNKLLGNFCLKNIPPAPSGHEPLDVTMEINEMGILEVRAVIRSTRGTNKITIKENRLGMSKEEVDRIISEADPAA